MKKLKTCFCFFLSRLLSLPYLPLLWHSWHRLLKESASCQTHLSEVQNPEWTLDHWTNYWSSSTNCNVRYWRLGYYLFLQVLKPLIWPRKEIFAIDIFSKLMKWKRLEIWVGARLNAWNIGYEIVVLLTCEISVWTALICFWTVSRCSLLDSICRRKIHRWNKISNVKWQKKM